MTPASWSRRRRARLNMDPDAVAPVFIPDCAITGSMQVGVALSGVTLDNVPDVASVTGTIAGVTINQSSRPVTLSGTPTAAGAGTLQVVQAGARNSPLAVGYTVLPAAPVNTVLPAITGFTEEGQTLTCSTGTWTNSPTSYAYQWFRKTGSEVAISGAFNATYKPVSADIGATLRCRVRAFNAGGGGSAYQVYSAYTATITIASPAPPVNTGLPTISGTTLIFDTLTGTGGAWTGASGGSVWQWMRDGADIPGATASTYTTTWADRGASITVEETRTNGSGASTSAVSVATVMGYELSPDALGIAASTHRYTHPTLVNPLEFGEARNDARPGTGVLASLSNANWQPSVVDTRQDMLGIGTKLFSGTLTRSVYKVRGGRAQMLVGFNTQGAEIDCSQMAMICYLEGFWIDARGLGERDQVTLGGTTGVSPGPRFVIQDARIYGTGGTNLATQVSASDSRPNAVALSDLRMTSSTTATATLAGLPVSGLPVTTAGGNQEILIYGSGYRGSVRTNQDFNQNWTVTAVTGGGGAGSVLTLACNDTTGRPAYTSGNPGNVNVADLTGAVCLVQGYQLTSPAAKIHPDCIQLNKDKPNAGIDLHRVDTTGGYQAPGIFGNSALSDSQKRFSLVTGQRDISQDPQDRRTTGLFTGGQAFTPAYTNQFCHVWLNDANRTYQSITSLFYPNPSITSVDYQVTALTSAAGGAMVSFKGSTGYQGAVYQGAVPDGICGSLGGYFTASTGVNKPGVGYQSRGYTLPAFTDGGWASDPFIITPGLTGGTAGHFKMVAGSAAGTEMGDIDVTGVPSTGYLVDVFISDASGALLANSAIKFEGRVLKRSSGALAAGAYSFYVTAVVYTLDATFARVATGIKRTKLVTETVV